MMEYLMNIIQVLPKHPLFLKEYNMSLTREKGTLQLVPAPKPSVRVRQFKDGDVMVILLNSNGEFVSEIANYRNNDGVYDIEIPLLKVKNELHFLYLVVNNEVTHLQEFYPNDFGMTSKITKK